MPQLLELFPTLDYVCHPGSLKGEHEPSLSTSICLKLVRVRVFVLSDRQHTQPFSALECMQKRGVFHKVTEVTYVPQCLLVALVTQVFGAQDSQADDQ